MRELTIDEIDEVNGGIAPLVAVVLVVGVVVLAGAAGYLVGRAIND